MKTRWMIALMLLGVLSLAGLAQRNSPQLELPRVPRGFDEGRTALMEEAAEGFIRPSALVERLFEEADLRELAEFVFLHLSPTEKALLDDQLRLEGELVRRRDADGVEALFTAQRLRAGRVATRIGDMLERQDYNLRDAVAWLYARGFNFRVLQSAMNGERIDCFQRRTEIRRAVARDRRADEIFELGFWTLNLLDGRNEAGGHYDGVQLVEGMLAAGFGPADFAAVMGLDSADKLSSDQRRLIQWGDPVLLWPAIERGLPESELARNAMAHVRRAGVKPELVSAALGRQGTIKRWFRTGGPGVTAVYTGPWADSGGEPKVPMAAVRELEDVREDEFAGHISGPIEQHFNHRGAELVVVLYDDGSARAMIRTTRPRNYGYATPGGNQPVAAQLYEGRVSLRGANGLLYAVFAGEQEVTPPELDLVNVRQRVGGALLRLDLDDGVVLTPMLLRRTTRLVEAP